MLVCMRTVSTERVQKSSPPSVGHGYAHVNHVDKITWAQSVVETNVMDKKRFLYVFYFITLYRIYLRSKTRGPNNINIILYK